MPSRKRMSGGGIIASSLLSMATAPSRHHLQALGSLGLTSSPSGALACPPCVQRSGSLRIEKARSRIDLYELPRVSAPGVATKLSRLINGPFLWKVRLRRDGGGGAHLYDERFLCIGAYR